MATASGKPANAAADALAQHLREFLGEPVQAAARAARGQTETCTANDTANADVAGNEHRFRLGVDQPDYVQLLRCFVSFAGAVLHSSVTRRAASYEFHPTSRSEAISHPIQAAATRHMPEDCPAFRFARAEGAGGLASGVS